MGRRARARADRPRPARPTSASRRSAARPRRQSRPGRAGSSVAISRPSRAVFDGPARRRRPAPPTRPAAGSRRADAAGRRPAPPAPRWASRTSRRARRETPARPPAAARSRDRWIGSSIAAARAVIRAPLDPDGALRHGRQHLVGRRSRFAARRASPSRFSPAMARNVAVGDPVLQLFQPGLHVAAKLDHLQVRAAGAAAARGAAATRCRPSRPRADRPARRHLGETNASRTSSRGR